MNIVAIYEEDEVVEYISKKNLTKQYQKSKKYILSGNSSKTNLKKRQPKWSGIYYFRINKQFRAIWYIRENNLIVVKIDNHQD